MKTGEANNYYWWSHFLFWEKLCEFQWFAQNSQTDVRCVNSGAQQTVLHDHNSFKNWRENIIFSIKYSKKFHRISFFEKNAIILCDWRLPPHTCSPVWPLRELAVFSVWLQKFVPQMSGKFQFLLRSPSQGTLYFKNQIRGTLNTKKFIGGTPYNTLQDLFRN